MWLFVTFCKQRQRNEQRIITHAYTAIELVAVAIKVCIIKLPKTEKTAKRAQNKRKPGRTKRRLRVQKTSLL